MKHLLLLPAIAALSLTACQSETQSKMDHSDMSAPHTDGVTIQNVYLVRPLPGRTTAMGVADIVNAGPASTLVAVSAPVSDRVELHTHKMEDGVMKMRKVEGGLSIGEKSTHRLKRGGDHIMVFDSALDPDAMTVPLTFTFAGGGKLVVDATVVNFEDLPEPAEMDHSGH